jgi:predicted DCC family thiol-disulfide oxidoreductase YuxK
MASEEGRRLAPDRPVDEMGLVGPGGEVWFGGDAWIVCLSTLTYWRWAAWVMSFAPAHQIVRLVYPLVAKNRQKLSRLLGTSCQIK